MKKIIKRIIYCFLVAIMAYFLCDSGFLFDKYIEYMQRKHAKELKLQKNNEDADEKLPLWPETYSTFQDILPTLKYKYNADRVYFFDYRK